MDAHDRQAQLELGARILGVGDRRVADLAVGRGGRVGDDGAGRTGRLDHHGGADEGELGLRAGTHLGRRLRAQQLLGQDELAGDRQDDRLPSGQVLAAGLVGVSTSGMRI